MFGTFQFRDAIFSRFALTKWNPRCALEMSRRRLKEPQGCTCNMPVLTQRCPLSLKAEITQFAEVRQPFQEKYFHWRILFGFFIVLEFERTVCMTLYDPRLTKTTNLLRILGPRRCAMHGLAALYLSGSRAGLSILLYPLQILANSLLLGECSDALSQRPKAAPHGFSFCGLSLRRAQGWVEDESPLGQPAVVIKMCCVIICDPIPV